jgi:hypothetical protein
MECPDLSMGLGTSIPWVLSLLKIVFLGVPKEVGGLSEVVPVDINKDRARHTIMSRITTYVNDTYNVYRL